MRALAHHRRSWGAVLAEVVMATFISGLLFTVMPGFYFSYIKIWSREGSRMAGTERASIVIQRMEKEVRNARGLTVSADGTGLVIVLPKQHADPDTGRMVNEIDASGQLMDGDQIHYYFVADPYNTRTGGGIYRRITRLDGTSLTARLITDQVHPELNPLKPGAGTPRPVFAYDSTLRTVSITATVAEERASSGNFTPQRHGVKCTHDGSALVRQVADGNPDGAVVCTKCGSQASPNAEIMTHQIQLLARNK